MDLGAAVQMDELQPLAEQNGIRIPRARGYRLMGDEDPVSKEEIKEMEAGAAACLVRELCDSIPFWTADTGRSGYSDKAERLKRELLHRNGSVDWGRIHGWKRKVLKFEVKKASRTLRKEFALWNRYAGRKDVLYIHARIADALYTQTLQMVKAQPWFLDYAVSAGDPTYCDIYAKLEAGV